MDGLWWMEQIAGKCLTSFFGCIAFFPEERFDYEGGAAVVKFFT